MADSLKVSIILPTLNEADNIIALIEKIYVVIPDLYEVIVVDDNSPDNTAGIVAEYSRRFPEKRIIIERRLTEHGLTNSIWHGITRAKGEVIVWMDCDFSMPPELIPELLKCIEEGYHIAVGSRFVRGGSFKRNAQSISDSIVLIFLSRIMNYFIQFLLDYSFKDYTSGFVAVRRPVFDEINLRGDYGEYFIDFIFRSILRGFRIIEVPYVCLPRTKGKSKTGQNLPQMVSRGLRYIAMVIRLRLEGIFFKPYPLRDLVINWEAASADNTGIEIKSLQREYIPLVAGIHHQVLSQTLNSRLGIPFLEDVYMAILNDPHAVCYVAFKNNRIAGFISCTLDLHRTKKFIMKSILRTNKIVAIISTLTNFSNLKDLISRYFFYHKFRGPSPFILTLGVSGHMQRLGIATRLVEESSQFFKKSGISEYFVDTLDSNLKATKFYQKLGFKKEWSFAGSTLFRFSLNTSRA